MRSYLPFLFYIITFFASWGWVKRALGIIAGLLILLAYLLFA